MIKIPTAFLLMLLLICAAPATRTLSAPPADSAIVCSNSAMFLQALDIARHQPNTLIELQPGNYPMQSEVVVQGDGTTIHGNGACIVSSAVYIGKMDPLTNAPTQGTALVVRPLLGRAVPFNKQPNGLWFNPPGTCEALNKAAGGSFQHFYEKAPCQDAVEPLTARYSLYAPYIIPARNITIDNLKIRYQNPQCDSAIYVIYAQNVLVHNLTVLNTPADLGKGGGPGALWADGSQHVTFDGCTGPTYIELNSSSLCQVVNCKVGGVTFEEMCRWCTVQKCTLGSCRTNDLLCSDIIFQDNTFPNKSDNIGCIWGGTRITFKNNKSAGKIWLGSETRNCIVTGNTAPSFDNYSGPQSGNVISNNTPTQ